MTRDPRKPPGLCFTLLNGQEYPRPVAAPETPSTFSRLLLPSFLVVSRELLPHEHVGHVLPRLGHPADTCRELGEEPSSSGRGPGAEPRGRASKPEGGSEPSPALRQTSPWASLCSTVNWARPQASSGEATCGAVGCEPCLRRGTRGFPGFRAWVPGAGLKGSARSLGGGTGLRQHKKCPELSLVPLQALLSP